MELHCWQDLDQVQEEVPAALLLLTQEEASPAAEEDSLEVDLVDQNQDQQLLTSLPELFLVEEGLPKGDLDHQLISDEFFQIRLLDTSRLEQSFMVVWFF